MSKKVKVIILRAAGTNCDNETKLAFEHLGSQADIVHINKIISKQINLSNYHIIAIPGGFTYGDDIAAGKILAMQFAGSLKTQITQFIKNKKLIIGICNGFQVLVKAGILPGNKQFTQQASLISNNSGKFEDRWVYLKPETSLEHNRCIWTKGINSILYLPVAHAEGKFVLQDSSMLKILNKNSQIVFRYADKNSQTAEKYPDNPNGSVESIAAICDTTGRILGMMPHPERNIFKHHHPRWTRKTSEKLSDGLKIFENGIKYIKQNYL